MERKEAIRKFLYKYIDHNSDCIHEAITKYVGVNKDLIKKDKDLIIKFFRDNFLISGISILYDELRYDIDNNEWIRLDDKRDLELFEQLIAVGYEAGVFEDDLALRFINSQSITREELRYALPDTFEYIDETYYEGLNKGIIKKNALTLDLNSYYGNFKREVSIKDLLQFWFCNNNIPAAKVCEAFNYYLDTNIDVILNAATYLFMKGCGPIVLLFELNKNIYSNIINTVEYTLKVCDEETKKDFYETRELFLNILESEYKKEIITKKKGL